jgi:tRNA modification GTPase
MFKLKDYNTKDTIAAIATFPAKSALGVIRISGKKSLPIAAKIFYSPKKTNLQKVKAFTLHYGFIVDSGPKRGIFISNRLNGRNGYIIDEVLLSIMRAPNSYTKEDVIEISCHGGVLVLDKILKLILKQGARLALPGEFTYRAVIYGRIDLIQAQSIFDIVEARSENGLDLAIRQLGGEASRGLREIKDKLKEIFGGIQAFIDFPEEEVVLPAGLKDGLEKIDQKLEYLISGSFEARAINEGVKCVICGRANAGKSTLFNYLLKEERVIVSPVPGTTRDVIEETITIKGVPLRIYDTAGILEPKDLVTRKAVAKSASIFAQADLVVLMVDGSRPLSGDDYFFLDKIRDKNVIIVISKIDKKQKINEDTLHKTAGYLHRQIRPGRIYGEDRTSNAIRRQAIGNSLLYCPIVKVSVLKNTGLNDLEKAVLDFVYKKGVARENLVFLSAYQQELLKKAQFSLRQAIDFINKNHTIDFVNLSIKESLDNLGKLTGEVYCEELLESIFSNFCIGK